MTHELYWDGDGTLARAYRKADELRQKRRNQNAWLQGMYIYEAIADCAPLLRIGEKRPKARPYPSEPYPITPADRREKAERERKASMENVRARLQAWATRTNAQIAAREEAARGRIHG